MSIDFNSLKYHVFHDYDIPFDEKGTTCGNVRLVQWVKEGQEPDREKAKVEIRKMYNSGSTEKLGKGYTFSTPEGPGELAVGLIKAGFGNTKDILNAIRTREDFIDSVKNIDVDEDLNSTGEMFDMRDLLLGLGEDNDTSYDEDDDELDDETA
jgi:hypothetical protein